MKSLFSLLAFTIFLHTTTINAQPVPEKEPDGYAAGQILLANNSTITGTIKDNIRKKGEVTILSDGKKTKYKAGEVTSVQIGSSNFITSNYTFYEVIWQGNNITLLRKANEPSGVQYNGVEPVVISGGEGDVDDYFVKKNNESSVQLLSKTNVKEILGKICTACAGAIEVTNLDISAIKKAIEACDKCK